MFRDEAPPEVLARRIEDVHGDLEFDIGPPASGRRTLVISAGGIREAFPAVESLVRGAPALDRWQVIPFRQKHPLPDPVTFQGLSLSPDSIRFETAGDGTGIVLSMPGYSHAEHSRYLALALILLDATLGEYDVEMKLGSISIEAPGSERRGLTLDRLADSLDPSSHGPRN